MDHHLEYSMLEAAWAAQLLYGRSVPANDRLYMKETKRVTGSYTGQSFSAVFPVSFAFSANSNFYIEISPAAATANLLFRCYMGGIEQFQFQVQIFTLPAGGIYHFWFETSTPIDRIDLTQGVPGSHNNIYILRHESWLQRKTIR